MSCLLLILAVPAGAQSEPGVAVSALSRGSGVPEAAREALARVRALFEAARGDGRVLQIVETRLGLEGETRLCAVTRDATAADSLLEEARRAAQGAELFNVVAEPCSRP
jgi:hypothetical protein